MSPRFEIHDARYSTGRNLESSSKSSSCNSLLRESPNFPYLLFSQLRKMLLLATWFVFVVREVFHHTSERFGMLLRPMVFSALLSRLVKLWSSKLSFIASLRDHVLHVVGMSSRKEMINCHAPRIVAGMENVQLTRITMHNGPCNPMSRLQLSIDAKLPISTIFETRCHPQTTAVLIWRANHSFEIGNSDEANRQWNRVHVESV